MAGSAGQLPPDVDWLERRVKELERRVREIEAGRGLQASSFAGGRLIFRDSSGNDRWSFGNDLLPSTIDNPNGVPSYGVIGRGDGSIVFALLEGTRGFVYPLTPVLFYRGTPVAVTSGTFDSQFESSVDVPPGEVIVVGLPITCDAATTGELRLIDVSSGITTDVLSIPASYNGFAEFQWIHPATTGWGDTRAGRAASLNVRIQGRRVSGAGNLNVYPPGRAYLASSRFFPDATASGGATLS